MVPDWVYRLLPGLRAREIERQQLRETAAALTTDKLRLQDQLIAAQEDRARLWDLVEDCLQGERTAYQMHVNMSIQKQGGGVPYPEAPHLPPNAVPPVGQQDSAGRKGRILPSEVLASRTHDFLENWLQPQP